MQRLQFSSWVRKIPWRRDRLPAPVFWGFPGGSEGKESACNAWDLDSFSELGISPGGGQATHQYLCLENPHGQRRLMEDSLCGVKGSDTAEQLSTGITDNTGRRIACPLGSDVGKQLFRKDSDPLELEFKSIVKPNSCVCRIKWAPLFYIHGNCRAKTT